MLLALCSRIQERSGLLCWAFDQIAIRTVPLPKSYPVLCDPTPKSEMLTTQVYQQPARLPADTPRRLAGRPGPCPATAAAPLRFQGSIQGEWLTLPEREIGLSARQPKQKLFPAELVSWKGLISAVLHAQELNPLRISYISLGIGCVASNPLM